MAATPERLVTAYHRRLLRIRDTTAARVGKLWVALGSIEDPARFATAAAAAAQAGQHLTAALVDAYLAAYTAAALTTPVAPTGLPAVDVAGPAARNGADPIEVYSRPTVTARRSLAAGRSWSDAMAAGADRATSTAETDVMLTHRAALVAVAVAAGAGAQSRITGYRRVLTGKSCPLCAGATSTTYRTDQLMPIHNHCDCGIAPVIGPVDPAPALNQVHLDRIEPANPRVVVHGELGEVLVDARHRFTGPSDLT